ncbi:MAG: coiled-coil domain-containing protein [Simkaniaceae bacterium]
MSTNQVTRREKLNLYLFYQTSSCLSPTHASIAALGQIRLRISRDAQKQAVLERDNRNEIESSSFFHPGYQKNDVRFQQIFSQIFAEVRGEEGLVHKTAYLLVERLEHNLYSDVYSEEIRTTGRGVEYDDVTDVIREATKVIKEDLKAILRKNLGFQWELLRLLRKTNRKIPEGLKLTDGNWYWYSKRADYGERPQDYMHFALSWLTLGAIDFTSTVFSEKLKTIYSQLLAIEWFKEDQKRLWEYLGQNLQIERCVSIPQETFEFNGITYSQLYTRGDGACALHALIGENTQGVFQYQSSTKAVDEQGVRSYFAKALTTAMKRTYNPSLQQALVETLKSHLDAALTGENPSSNRLFAVDAQGFEILRYWEAFKNHYNQRIQAIQNQEAKLWVSHLGNEAFMRKIMSEVQSQRRDSPLYRKPQAAVLQMIRKKPSRLLNLINAEPNAFLRIVEDDRITRLRGAQKGCNLERDGVLQQFVLSDPVYNHYIQGIQDEQFWFNTQEIELGALLFNKKLLLVGEGASGIEPFARVNESLTGSPVVIHFNGVNHFSRCLPRREDAPPDLNELKDLYFNYFQAQQRGKAYWERDIIAQQAFYSAFKQEVCDLGMSSAWSYATVNPIPLFTQSVKSTVNLATLYFDPFRDNLLTNVVRSVPISQIAMGVSPEVIITSLSVDIGVRALWEHEKRDKGVESGEGVKRLMVTAVTGMILRDEDRMMSGLFSDAVSIGMDKAHYYVQGVDLQDEYWMQNPSWKDCGVRTLFTHSTLQDHVAGKLKDFADEITGDNPPVINLEVQEHLKTLQDAKASVEPDLIQLNAGVAEAQRKVEEKWSNYQKIVNNKKSSVKDIDKALDSLDRAHQNLRHFKELRDNLQAYINGLSAKMVGLGDRLYSPIEEQDFLNRVADFQVLSERERALEQQRNQQILSEKEAVEKKAKAERDAAYKKMQAEWWKIWKLGLGHGPACDVYQEAKAKYEETVRQTNIARAVCNLPPKPPKDPKPFFIDKALGKASDVLTDIGVESINVNMPIMATSSPKTIEGYHERQMEKAASGLPTDVVLGHAGPEGVTWKNPKPITPPQIEDPPSIGYLLTPSPQRPLIGSFGGEWNWQSFQVYQKALTMAVVEQAIADRNMVLSSHMPLDLSDPNRAIESAHKEIWEQGFLDNSTVMKLPSMQQAGFDLFDVNIEDGRSLHLLIDNDFVKSIPKGLGRVGIATLKFLVPNMSDVSGAEDPHAQLDRLAQNVGRMYDEMVHMEDPNSFAAKAGTLVGECLAVSPVFKIVRLAQLPGVFCAIAEGSTVGAIFAQADNQSPLEGALIGGALGGGVHKLVGLFQFSRGGALSSLMNRAQPIENRMLQPLKSEAAFLRGMNPQVYRSGFVGEGTVARLTDRQIREITPLKLPSVQVGEELNWLSHNLPKVRQLQQVKGMDRFDQYLRQTFKDQNLTEMQLRRVLNYSGFNTYPKPLPSPINVVVEISKSNGGMIYRLAGTTDKQNLVVRVCPGLAKESIVSSVLKGNHLNGKMMNGTLRQQYPYVVQRRGKEILTQDGRWLEMDRLSNKDKALTHIPLEIYEFKGW